MRILIAAGASGGHIFPALSLSDALKKKDKDICVLLILPERSKKNKLSLEGFKVKYISAVSLTLRPNLKNLSGIFKFLKATLESLFIIIEFKPDAVIGFGTIETIPLLFFSWLFRIKTFIHEQNVIPGRANRFLAKLVDKAAISFPSTAKYLGIAAEKIILTGNPIRKELERIDRNEARDFFGLDREKFTILVIGGSQGSSNINSGITQAVSGLAGKKDIQLIHITGAKDYEKVCNAYRLLVIDAKVITFLNSMQFAYSAADLAICRSGATTIAELIKFSLPAILIPYPYAYGHQLHNAKVLEEKGCGFIIEDKQLSQDILKNKLSQFLTDADALKKMRLSFSGLDSGRDPADLLAEEVIAFNSK